MDQIVISTPDSQVFYRLQKYDMKTNRYDRDGNEFALLATACSQSQPPMIH